MGVAKKDVPWPEIAEADVAERQSRGGASKPQPRQWSTTDLGIAAFVHMRGVAILGVRRDSSNRFSFDFDDSADECEALTVEYINSCCRKFDAAVRNMKKLAHGGSSSRRR